MASKLGGVSPKKPKCKYWGKCYRKEKAHRDQFLHLGDDSDKEDEKSDAATSSKTKTFDLDGKKVLFLGTFKSGSLKTVSARAEEFGCIVVSVAEEDVDFVIQGDNVATKADKAKMFGLRIVTEFYWENLLDRAKPVSGKKTPKKDKNVPDDSDTDEEPSLTKGKKTTENKKKLKRQGTHEMSFTDDSKALPESKKTKPKLVKADTLGGTGSPEVNIRDDSDMDTSDENEEVRKKQTKRSAESDSEDTPSPKKQKAGGAAAAAKQTDDDTGAKKSPAKGKKKTAKCKYWDKCYRKEKAHLDTFLHPGDDPSELDEASSDTPSTLKDGEDAEITAGNRTYRIKRTGDSYYCTCIGWKTQKIGIDKRTCKHLREYLGDEFENERVGASPSKPTANKGGEATIFRSPKHKQVSLLLAHKWEEDKDPTGWWMSEKLDGVRAFWDGKAFYSRLGNEFIPPPSFVKDFPTDMTLDGELFGGRGKFQSTVAIVKNAGSSRWKEVKYYIFDSPSLGKEPFEKRIKTITDYFEKNDVETAYVVEHTKCTGRHQIAEDLERVESLGGEGLMIREPGSIYEHRRSNTLLKIKNFYDAEARVIGYDPGKGRNAGVVGALRCEMECGKKFSVGSGLKDADRKRPPKIGSIITYKFQEYTNSGSPRFPTYIGLRIDTDAPKDAVLPAGKEKSSDV